MGRISAPQRVKPVCAVTFAPGLELDGILRRLEPLVGAPDGSSPVFDFNFTEYYESEMGPGLKKVFFSFTGTILPGDLVRLKLATNELETAWMLDRKRRVNLDPGYVTRAKLVLASTKDFAHRVFLGEGIYGDVQLQFRHGKWRPSGWTFPDYRTDLAKAFFAVVRNRCASSLDNL
jgi:hypothetical protein